MTDDPTDNPGIPLLPPTYPFLFLIAAIGLDFLVPIPFLSQPALVSLTTLFAIILIGAGLGLVIWAMRVFRAAGTNVEPFKPTLTIVTTGPYQISRNPIYLGFILIFLGLCIGFSLEWGLLGLPFLWLTLDRVVVTREETYLTRKFGTQYASYLMHTRRWL